MATVEQIRRLVATSHPARQRPARAGRERIHFVGPFHPPSLTS